MRGQTYQTNEKREKKLSQLQMIMRCGSLGGAAFWWRSIASAQDIEWQFDDERMHFLGLSKSADEEPWVISFQTSARNKSGEPILNVESYIRSDLNNERRRVLFKY